MRDGLPARGVAIPAVVIVAGQLRDGVLTEQATQRERQRVLASPGVSRNANGEGPPAEPVVVVLGYTETYHTNHNGKA